MAFKNFVCWRPEMVPLVMDTEALQTSDEIFLATHYPLKAYRQDSADIASYRPYEESDFLRDFMAPEDYVFAAVLGEAGTGKSHLIRWLSTQIPRTENRKVLLIPKSGTNLRDIIRMILQDMEGPQFDRYRNELNRSAEFVSHREAMERLLDNLAIEVGPARNSDRELTETQEELAQEIPDLLHDPFFRSHLLKEKGIIDKLTTHVLGNSGQVERLDERREFHGDDLPLNITNVDQASQRARLAYIELSQDEAFREEAVDWINQHLDAAISRMLSLSGNDLLQLMTEVRESLAEQGVELVILIEDFAKLQGIDMQLLEAMLVRPNQPGKRLCNLRVALASTTGYLQRQLDTVRQRISFVVHMSLADSAEHIVTDEDIQRLAARYLNAARMSSEQISEWYDNRDGDLSPVTSACGECPHSDLCHGAFGESDGFGLYPFNTAALHKMTQRSGASRFTPRNLINHVLKHTMESYRDHLERGNFPPPALQEHFGRPSLGQLVIQDINRRDPQNGDRRRVLLEFWQEGGELVNLSPVIHEAFSIPELPNLDTPTPPAPEPSPVVDTGQRPPVTPMPVPQVNAELQRKLDELDSWGNGGILSQRLAQELRTALFPAISNSIEWDFELMLKGSFTGERSPFRRDGIRFENAAASGRLRTVNLTLPLSKDELTDTVVALQGMLQFVEYGHWKFEGGGRYFRTYKTMLDRWGQSVLEQVRSASRTQKDWDPVPSVVELLAIGARMAGRPNARTASLDERISALFMGIDTVDTTSRSNTWKTLFAHFANSRESMLEVLKSRTACTKGGSPQVRTIDAARLVAPLRDIQSDWRPKTDVPEDLGDTYRGIRQFKERADELLERAILEEKERHVAWLDRVTSELGDEPDRKAVIDALKSAMTRATAEGVFPTGMREGMNEAIAEFQRVHFNNCVEGIRRITNETDPGQLLGELGRNYGSAMRATDDFLNRTRNFLVGVSNRVESNIREHPEGAEFESVQNTISSELGEISVLMESALEVGE